MIKRILLIGIICILISSCVLAEGKVYDIDTVAEFLERMENAEDGATIRLTKNLTITERLGSDNEIDVTSNITLDMNGKTLRNERTGVERTIDVRPNGMLTIVGNGRFENKDHDSDFIQALGPLFIYSGHFAHDPFTWGDLNCPYKGDSHETNYRKLGYLISSYIGKHKTEDIWFNGHVTVYGGTFDSGVKNPQDVYDVYKMGTDENKHKVCYYMYPIINEGNNYAHGVTIYGGTYVTADPANGEGNWCDGNVIKDPYYLKDQQKLYVVPEPYTRTVTAGNDGRMNYSLDYPVTLKVKKKVTNYTEDEVALSGFQFELKNQVSGKRYTAVTDGRGEVIFNLPLEDAEDRYTLCEIPGKDENMKYSSQVYEVRVIPGPKEERYKPIAQAYLDGAAVETPVFENIYFKQNAPNTGDTQNLAMYLALACGSILMLTMLVHKRES